MKAIVQESYGAPMAVLAIRETKAPAPKAGEVLVKVLASSINQADWSAVTGRPWPVRMGFGLRRPKFPTPGRDVAGVIEAVGPGVTRFKRGDGVVGEVNQRAWAEFVCASEKALALKPVALEFTDVATLPVAGTTALQGLRDHGQLQQGQRMLINGASGSVGTFAIQVAKILGAQVTAVCSPHNVDTARSLGADHVVDYTSADFTQTDARYDLIFDIAASKPLAMCRHILAPTGRYVACSGSLGWVFKVAVSSMFKGWVVGPWVANSNPEDLGLLMEWIVSGRLKPAVVRTIGLEEVANAVREQGEGHSRGKTAIRL